MNARFRTPAATSMAATLANIGRQHTQPIADMHKRLEKRGTDTLKVFVGGAIISDGVASYPVTFNGKSYIVNRHLLEAMRAGETPESLELVSVEDDADAIEYPTDDRACSIADRLYQSKREGQF